jgi:hypothetical protein
VEVKISVPYGADAVGCDYSFRLRTNILSNSRTLPRRTHRLIRSDRATERKATRTKVSTRDLRSRLLSKYRLRQCFRNPKPTDRGFCPWGLSLSLEKLTARRSNKRANIIKHLCNLCLDHSLVNSDLSFARF